MGVWGQIFFLLWRLPTPTKNSPLGFKYRLFYGLKDGTPDIRYDNEKGKKETFRKSLSKGYIFRISELY